jgi:hypothetical protein
MKSTIVTVLAITIATGLVFAQGFSGSSQHPGFDPKRPPPLALPEAYTLATARLGATTNRFFCVSATCVEPAGFSIKAWTFGFSNTNGQMARVKVFFNQDVFVDARSVELLK